VVATVASFPVCIDFLPGGRLLVVDSAQRRLLRCEPDGSPVTHADLSAVSAKPWNDIVVDDQGNAHVNTIGFEFPAASSRRASSCSPRRTAISARSPATSRSEGRVRRDRRKKSGRWPVLHPARAWIVELAAAGDLRMLLARSFAFEDARDAVPMPDGPSAGTGGRYARPRRPGRAAAGRRPRLEGRASCLGAARGSGNGGNCGAGLPVIIYLR
jgi:hypothetical protein